MNNAVVAKAKKISSVLAIAAALAVVLSGAPAFASGSASGSVAILEYQGVPSSPLLLLQIASVNYTAVTTSGATCASITYNNTIDTIKAWQSLAQSSVLSGKSVKVYFTTCAGTNYITTLDLDQ